MDPREKRRTKYHLQRPEAYEALSQQYRLANTEGSVTKCKGQTSQSQSREARSNQRRQLAVLGDEAVYSDLLKFNQLKVSWNNRIIKAISKLLILSARNLVFKAICTQIQSSQRKFEQS
jgi:hypothetical protein